MLTGAPFFELESKDGTRHNRGEEDEDGDEKQISPPDLTASMVTRVLKSIQ